MTLLAAPMPSLPLATISRSSCCTHHHKEAQTQTGHERSKRNHTELRAAPVQYLWLVCVDRVFWASRTCIIMAATRKGKPSSASNPDPSSWLAFTIAPDQRDTNRESA